MALMTTRTEVHGTILECEREKGLPAAGIAVEAMPAVLCPIALPPADLLAALCPTSPDQTPQDKP